MLVRGVVVVAGGIDPGGPRCSHAPDRPGSAPPATTKTWAALTVSILASAIVPFTATGSTEIEAIEMAVAELPRAIAFYTDVLQFQTVAQELGIARLRLGEETLILREHATPTPIVPDGLLANDRSFQHIAIVVSDIDAAYAHLLRHNTRIVSTGVQRLPEWNFDAAGIRALYFRGPDGHFLELIQFPRNKGEPRWHRRTDALFRGIDHTAIVVSDLKASTRFYRDVLGFTIIGNSFNYGGEQELLNGVAGSRVRITSFRGINGPGVELLHYEAPGSSVTAPSEASPAWRMHLVNSRAETGGETTDPDGHALLLADKGRAVLYRPSQALRQRWERYLMEGAELGIFMAVALWLALALEHPKSRVRQAIASPLLRRFLFGTGIGVTVVILIYCTWGRQSGAQFNPAVTLAMLYLQRIQPWDAFFYIIAQFVGGLLGVLVAAAPFWKASAHKDVTFVMTAPGKPGVAIAFTAEFVICFILMATLRLVYQSDSLKPLLGYFAGLLLLVYITFEAPLSGMSLNPARSVASAIPARSWNAIWIYFAAPILAMLLAAMIFG